MNKIAQKMLHHKKGIVALFAVLGFCVHCSAAE